MNTATLPEQPRFARLFTGLTVKRLALTLVISALMAAITKPYVLNPYPDLLVTTVCLGISILFCYTIASNLAVKGRAMWAAIVGSVILGSMLGTLLTILVKGKPLADIFVNPDRLSGFFITASIGLGLGFAMIVTYRSRERSAREEAERLRSDAERSRLEKQVIAAELKLMQAQVEPHFLFNTLAAVQHLIEVDPTAANRMLSSLIRYLRAALPQMRTQESTVRQEFDLARAYLDIAAMRLCGRLTTEFSVPADLAFVPMPPMMLISLVENAITHGVEECCDNCNVTVSATEQQGRLIVRVADTGAGLGEAKPGGGIGLSNIRERLKALYGDRARLVIESGNPRGVSATIELPMTRMSA